MKFLRPFLLIIALTTFSHLAIAEDANLRVGNSLYLGVFPGEIAGNTQLYRLQVCMLDFVGSKVLFTDKCQNSIVGDRELSKDEIRSLVINIRADWSFIPIKDPEFLKFWFLEGGMIRGPIAGCLIGVGATALISLGIGSLGGCALGVIFLGSWEASKVDEKISVKKHALADFLNGINVELENISMEEVISYLERKIIELPQVDYGGGVNTSLR